MGVRVRWGVVLGPVVCLVCSRCAHCVLGIRVAIITDRIASGRAIYALELLLGSEVGT